MAVVSSRDAGSNLESKGFHRREAKGHTWFDLYIDDQFVGISTHISRGKDTHSDIGNNLIDAMKNELCLNTNSEAYALLKCPMSRERYLDLLRSRNKLDPPKVR